MLAAPDRHPIGGPGGSPSASDAHLRKTRQMTGAGQRSPRRSAGATSTATTPAANASAPYWSAASMWLRAYPPPPPMPRRRSPPSSPAASKNTIIQFNIGEQATPVQVRARPVERNRRRDHPRTGTKTERMLSGPGRRPLRRHALRRHASMKSVPVSTSLGWPQASARCHRESLYHPRPDRSMPGRVST